VSVRPLELAPPDRVAQTSLVLDATGGGWAARHGPDGGALANMLRDDSN
jgi:hypothetical protein